MEREISIIFGSNGYQMFEECETDCTDAQVTAFADVCATIYGSAAQEISIKDVRTLKFGSGD